MPEPLFTKLGIYIMANEPISVAYLIYPSHPPVCLYVYPLSLIGNGSADTLSGQRIHAAVEEFLKDSFSIRSVSYQRKVGD
jgi:hypothetical protein